MEPALRHPSILRDAAFYSLAAYVVQPLSIASSMVVRGYVGTYGAGVLATLSLLLFYVSFAHAGVLNAAERELPYSVGQEDHARTKRITDTTFFVTIAAGALSATIVLTLTLIFAGGIDRRMALGLAIYAPYTALWFWSAFFLTVLRSKGDFVYLSKIQVLVAAISAVGGVAGALLAGLEGVLASLVLVATIQAAILTARVGKVPTPKIDPSELRHLLGIGVPLLALGLATTGIRTLDNMLVLKWLGTDALGTYTIALVASAAVYQFAGSIGGVLYPRMQYSFGRGDTVNALGRYVLRPTLLLAETLPLLIALIVFGLPPIVDLFLPEFSEGLPAMKVVAIGAFWLALTPMAMNLLVAVNRQLLLTSLLLLSMGAWIGLAGAATAYQPGLEAMAFATVGGYFVCYVFVNMAAALQWTDAKNGVAFLWTASVPGLYMAVTIPMIDKLVLSSMTQGWEQAAAAGVRAFVFVCAYAPVALIMERRTQLFRDVVGPILMHVRASAGRTMRAIAG